MSYLGICCLISECVGISHTLLCFQSSFYLCCGLTTTLYDLNFFGLLRYFSPQFVMWYIFVKFLYAVEKNVYSVFIGWNVLNTLILLSWWFFQIFYMLTIFLFTFSINKWDKNVNFQLIIWIHFLFLLSNFQFSIPALLSSVIAYTF